MIAHRLSHVSHLDSAWLSQLLFELSDAGLQAFNLGVDLPFGNPPMNMLRTVDIPSFYFEKNIHVDAISPWYQIILYQINLVLLPQLKYQM